MREDRPVEDQVADADEDPELEDEVKLTRVERAQHVVSVAFAAASYPLRASSATISSFLHSWRTSRPTELIVWGLPAATVLLVAGYLALALQPTPSELIVTYREAAAEAAEAGDTDTASLWLEKTLQLNPLDPEHRYNLALAAVLNGQEERAREIIASLAPEDDLGHPAAHFWLVGELMEHKQSLSPSLPPETVRRIEHHLLQSAVGGESRVEAHAMLGEFYLDRNEVNKAIHHFGQAAPERPRLYFSLAQALRIAGREEESLEPAAKARNYFQRLTQEDPLVADHRRGWAFAEQLLGNHQEAVRILEAGLDSDDSQSFRESLVDVYINWHNAQVLDGKANLAWQLEVLRRALEFGPKDPRLLTQLAKLAMRDWEQADEAVTMLKELVARGVAPALVHLVIGTQSLKQGDLADASAHLQLANDRNPETPAIMNNLAWLLAHQEDPDLPRALELARTANKLSPRPEIHDTVGTILVMMGRNREAIVELETALRGLPENTELHLKLADAYEKLGKQDLARIHRRLAGREVVGP